MALEWRIEEFEELPSTQDTLKQLVEEEPEQGLVVHALRQSAGHGRHGREWVSQEGNLFFSFLLRPECGPEKLGQISLLFALATAHVIQQVAQGAEIVLKWPNDVMLAGKKCAGILLESGGIKDGKVEWIAGGAGVNVAAAPPEGRCLAAFSEEDVTAHEVRDLILGRISDLYEDWQKNGFEDIRQGWMKMSYPIGTLVQVKVGDGVRKGRFHDIDENGALIIKSENGALEIITAGDVYI